MKYVTCSTSEQLKIEWSNHIIEGNKHIKYAKNRTEIIEYITANKNKLTEKLYALAKKIYLTPDDSTHFAYAMKQYNYKTLHKQIPEIDNKYILFTINKMVNELLAIDVVYWDIHSGNFFVKGKKVIVMDLDEAKLGITPERMQIARYNYIDLIFHLYLGYVFNDEMDYLNFFLNYLKIGNYLSKDASDYIESIYEECYEQIDRDPTFLISEFEDKERCDYLKSKTLGLVQLID